MFPSSLGAPILSYENEVLVRGLSVVMMSSHTESGVVVAGVAPMVAAPTPP